MGYPASCDIKNYVYHLNCITLYNLFLLLSAILLYRLVRHLVNPLATVSGWFSSASMRENTRKITIEDIYP